MSASIVNFDDYHPDFAERHELPPEAGAMIYRGGVFLGSIKIEPEIRAFTSSWELLGCFASLDGATRAILASSDSSGCDNGYREHPLRH